MEHDIQERGGQRSDHADAQRERVERSDIRLSPDRIELKIVLGDLVPLVWDKFEVGALFKEQEEKSGGHWTAEFLKEQLLAGKLHLWLVLKGGEEILAALVTDINPYPNGLRTCMVTVIVGKNPGAWIGLESTLSDWAKENGCTKMEVIGRPGWKRVFPDSWRASATFYEKSLVS